MWLHVITIVLSRPSWSAPTMADLTREFFQQPKVQVVKRLLKRLSKTTDQDPAVLAALGRWLSGEEQAYPVELYISLGAALLRFDVPLTAYDVALAGLRRHIDNLQLLRLKAFALCEARAFEEANVVLGDMRNRLHDQGFRFEETLELLARTHRNLALAASGKTERLENFQKARDAFRDAYQYSGRHFAGINAATLSVVIGDLTEAIVLARSVFAQCHDKLKGVTAREEDYYWIPATLAEAALILGETKQALKFYRQAARRSKRRYRYLRSTRRNARLLIKQLTGDHAVSPKDQQHIEECLQLPRVVVFVGHMIDQEDRDPPRFPSDLDGAVYETILKQLESYGSVVGYSSAACGSDILFQEAVRKSGGESHVVLPYDPDHFADHSVRYAGQAWVDRYRTVLENAVEVVTVSPNQKLSWGSISYDYANTVLTGLAIQHAGLLESELASLAVWDGGEGDGPGGTEAVVKRWRKEYGLNVEIIDLVDLLRQAKHPGVEAARGRTATRRQQRSQASSSIEVQAIMFADVQNFSALTEEQMPNFVERFLYMIGTKAAISPNRPKVQESRGDGVFFIFDNVGAAGRFALQLNDELSRMPWLQFGLPEDLNVRIALHVGPVYGYICPFSKLPTYTGNHVVRTARIEPVTPPGEVYSSREFAALACGNGDFICQYAGLAPLAKGYGLFPLYHVRRRHRAEAFVHAAN